MVETRLENIRKDIFVKGKEKEFYITEKMDYEYQDEKLKKLMYSNKAGDKKKFQYAMRNRMQLIYNLGSKKKVAEYLLQNFIPTNDKYLIFAGNIEHANELCEYRFHSKNKKFNKKHLKAFEDGQTNRLSCVNALNEGVNISGIDGSMVLQVNSNERDFIQRVGRNIRYVRNHVGVIVVLCCIDTQDKKWVDSALESFNEEDIIRISYGNILVGNFNFEEIKIKK